MADRPFLLTHEVAKRLGVTKNTVRKWAADKELTPEWTTPGGQARYTVEAVEAFLAKQRGAANESVA
jgi:excisionase family DNA binding protein